MYPITEPYQSGLLQVSAIHQIYWEESGNPAGKPVIFLHGGPGAGASPACRGFFNPEKYRIIIILTSVDAVVPCPMPVLTTILHGIWLKI
ncbi:hypothetical protein [Snodgrassella sp. W8132]|uniref:hypothetical protein n=1 Tax=Snodgrassella sp. W8132 TaxID=2750994 RepID=UPI00351BAB7F